MTDPVVTACVVAGVCVLLRGRRGRRPKARNRPRVVQEVAGVRPLRALPPPSSKRERLLEQYVSDDPKPGSFYQIQPTDSFPEVIRRALDTVGQHTAEMRSEYMCCVSSGPAWNLRLYGTPSVTKRFPRQYLLPGLGKGLCVAFRKRNDDALAALLEGRLPVMTVDESTGAPKSAGDRYGLLWLPPVDPEAFGRGEISCAKHSWPDGSSAIDPDPELLRMLEAAA